MSVWTVERKHSSQSLVLVTSHGPVQTQETQVLEDHHQQPGLPAGGEDQGGAAALVSAGPAAVLQIPPPVLPPSTPGLHTSAELL